MAPLNSHIDLNFEYFIAKRVIFNSGGKSTISSPIIKMAITAIAVGVVVMLIAIATGVGLQQKIREKLVVFHGHIQIFNYDNNASEVSIKPISLEQPFYPQFKDVPAVKHIQAVATKGGILRTPTTYEAILAKASARITIGTSAGLHHRRAHPPTLPQTKSATKCSYPPT